MEQQMKEVLRRQCDVLVIGGGPAGTTVAPFLAEKGYKVEVTHDRIGHALDDALLDSQYRPAETRLHLLETLALQYSSGRSRCGL